jgi:hypothetical protein
LRPASGPNRKRLRNQAPMVSLYSNSPGNSYCWTYHRYLMVAARASTITTSSSRASVTNLIVSVLAHTRGTN